MPQIDIVLTEHFPLLSLTLITEPLRVANRELGGREWTWRLLSTPGGEMFSSSGIGAKTGKLDEVNSDIVLLLSSYNPETALVRPLLAWLRRKARTGCMMGCVDTGAMIFAEAGLLSKAPAAVHFEAIRGYRETYQDQLFVDRMFDISQTRCSSAGGVATFDMTLGLIERFGSNDLAIRVAEILTYRPMEFEGPQQKMLSDTTLMHLDRNLAKAVDLMLSHLQDPLPIGSIANAVGLPIWTMARLFNRYFKQTPSAYYRHLRLTQARNLLLNSNHRISEIARLCGFENPESFSRAYRREFSRSASQERENAS